MKRETELKKDTLLVPEILITWLTPRRKQLPEQNNATANAFVRWLGGLNTITHLPGGDPPGFFIHSLVRSWLVHAPVSLIIKRMRQKHYEEQRMLL